MYGISSSGYGGYFTSSSGSGVYGSGVIGVTGISSASYGVGGSSTATDGYGGFFYDTATGGGGIYAQGVTGGFAGVFDGDIKVNGYTISMSDIRLKKNVQPLERSIDQLLKLKGVTFEWKEPEKHGDHRGSQIGFIAQDVEKVFPEWVRTDKEGFKALSVAQLEGLEVESIRTLKLKNDALEERVRTLENGGHPATAGSGFNFSGNNLGLLGLAAAVAYAAARRKKVEVSS